MEEQRDLLNSTEEQREKAVDALHNSDYRRANPGDYKCPHCKYITLKYEASRCPLCHGEIESYYWYTIRAAEKEKEAAAKAAAEEWKRTAPEREAAERAAKQKCEAEEIEAKQKREACEAEEIKEKKKRKRKALRESASNGAWTGATLGGIILGISGAYSCLNNYTERTPVTNFNLISGLLDGAFWGALLGAFLGFLYRITKD